MEIAILDVEMGIRITNITTYNTKPKDLQFQFIFSNKIKTFSAVYNFKFQCLPRTTIDTG